MDDIRERLKQDRYEIDLDAVARALIERLLAWRADSARKTT